MSKALNTPIDVVEIINISTRYTNKHALPEEAPVTLPLCSIASVVLLVDKVGGGLNVPVLLCVPCWRPKWTRLRHEIKSANSFAGCQNG